MLGVISGSSELVLVEVSVVKVALLKVVSAGLGLSEVGLANAVSVGAVSAKAASVEVEVDSAVGSTIEGGSTVPRKAGSVSVVEETNGMLVYVRVLVAVTQVVRVTSFAGRRVTVVSGLATVSSVVGVGRPPSMFGILMPRSSAAI
jgi:hypothetical protein